MVTSFWIHGLCLYATKILTGTGKRKNQKRNMFFAALLCTIVDLVLLVMVTGSNIGRLCFPLIVACVVAELYVAARIAYGKRESLKNGLRLFCMTALIAGLFQVLPVKNVGLFCMTGTIFMPVLSNGITTIFRAKQTGQWMYEATLCQRQEERKITAFMDTGNRLRLYGRNLPVVLVDEVYLNDWIKVAEKTMPQKLVVLPYKGVGGKGLLRGVRLQLQLMNDEGKLINGEVAAVAAEHRLFQGCEYQMILQPEVLVMTSVTNTQEGVHNVI